MAAVLAGIGIAAPGAAGAVSDGLYDSPGALCRHVNAGRQAYAPHDRYRGDPWRGAYHTSWTWPVTFLVDADLDGRAAAEAARLASGGEPAGGRRVDSPWRSPVWIAGVGTTAYTIATRDRPEDRRHGPGPLADSRLGLAASNGAARMGLFYQDPGPAGPALTRMGCGGAVDDEGGMWWVIVLAP